LKPPFAQDEAFLADVERARPAKSRLHLWWLGQSGFLLQWQGRDLLLDPYLSDTLTEKYARTDKPHVRLTARVVAPERLGFVDAVTSSHNHTDHLDAGTLKPLLAANPRLEILVPAANRAFAAERLGVAPERLRTLDAGEATTLAGFEIRAVPAAHETMERDELGRCRFVGYLVQAGPWTVYHAGDTVRFSGMEPDLRAARIDVALLPINGRAPERRVAGNLTGREAAQLARDLGARWVIPCHYDLFEFNTASPDEFVEECRRLGQAFKVLRQGEGWTCEGTTPP
jgi:L-ascorbate metabolism protein UlaG (beta-lactamase superfamily)